MAVNGPSLGFYSTTNAINAIALLFVKSRVIGNLIDRFSCLSTDLLNVVAYEHKK